LTAGIIDLGALKDAAKVGLDAHSTYNKVEAARKGYYMERRYNDKGEFEFDGNGGDIKNELIAIITDNLSKAIT